MKRNVEIKARVANPENLLERARDISKCSGIIMHQEDVFFKVHNGRLKLRQETISNKSEACLISYNRPDGSGPRMSQYQKCEVADGEGLRAVLDNALGIKGEVKKTRILFIVGQTRIHVDTVENLGSFMELEVMLKDGETEEMGQEIAHSLMKQLDITEKDLISVAYMDLMQENSTSDIPLTI